MGNLLFSPNGRIGPAEFMRGATILIIIGAVIQLLPLISIKLSMMFSIFGLVAIWCWVVLWIKRFHDGGKSGWMSLVAILGWLAVSVIAGMLLMPLFAGDAAQQAADMTEAMENAGEAGDIGGMMSMVMDIAGSSAKKTAIPNAILSAIIAGAVAYVGNMLIKHDPNDNQWGAAGSGSVLD